MKTHTQPNPSLTLKKALMNMAAYWQLSQQDVAQIIGKSPAAYSRMLKNNEHGIEPSSTEGELTLMLLRVYRGLNAFLGNKQSNELAWLKAYNHALCGVPLELMKSVQGLARVMLYIDTIRGKI